MIAKENGSIFYVLFESLLADSRAHVCMLVCACECLTRENVSHHILGEEIHLEILYLREVY